MYHPYKQDSSVDSNQDEKEKRKQSLEKNRLAGKEHERIKKKKKSLRFIHLSINSISL